jgi:hypothetical protein
MFAHSWDPRSSSSLIGFGPKVTLRPESRGLGVGFSAFVALDTGTDRLSTAVFNLPVSIPVNQALHLNVNVGGDWSQAVHRWTMSTGLQAELTVRANMEIMVEGLVRAGEKNGFQVGPRWTVDKGRMDIDLLAARYADGLTARALTIGVTMRR